MSGLLANDGGVVLIVSALSVVAVGIPLYRGLKLCLHARGATRHLRGTALERSGGSAAAPGEPLGRLMLRVLRASLRESGSEGYSSHFVVDASRQYVVNEYEENYARPISMYANLLPPIGFIGTTGGMLILLLSIHLSDASLELGALALALLSSLFALIGFALLEAIKIRLYGRLLRCLGEVVSFHHSKLGA